MRLIFLGTPEFAVPTLERIVGAGHEVLAVYHAAGPAQRPGRGARRVSASSRLRLRLGLAVHQPERIKRPEAIELLAALQAGRHGGGRLRPDHSAEHHRHSAARHRQRARLAAAQIPRRRARSVGHCQRRNTHRRHHHADRRRAGHRRHSACRPKPISARRRPRWSLRSVWRAWAPTCLSRRSRVPDHRRASRMPPRPRSPPFSRRKTASSIGTRAPREIYNRVRGFLPWPGAYTHFRGQICTSGRRHRQPCLWVFHRDRFMRTSGASTPPAAKAPLELLEVQLEGRKRITAEAFPERLHLLDNESLGKITV